MLRKNICLWLNLTNKNCVNRNCLEALAPDSVPEDVVATLKGVAAKF